jgi:DNA-binding HxlR family transcriptional regulator
MSASKKALSGNHERARPNPVEGCPLTAAFAAIGGKWKLIIIYWLAESPKHFAALRKAMLRELMSDGLVNREAKGAVPAPVIYSLSDYGRSVLPLVEDVRRWGRGHLSRS